MTRRAITTDTPARPAAPRRGLRREDAALYVGVSPSLFDRAVKDGQMPRPVKLFGAVIWDVQALDRAFDALTDDKSDAAASGQAAWDQALAEPSLH